ncbi:MAG: uracil-DNA glycosylase [Oscillibacter sp.]|nr:uracil-DNA glycosylase [Oscillibacter sp.]MBQ9618798.1 uracil-DNA glycosylase [Oscillibacter sp.]
MTIPDAWAALMDAPAVREAARLSDCAEERRAAGETILPPQPLIFRALELTPPDKTRCVILGQDPYHTPGVANGLAFSANPGCKIPPSLRNIFKELSADIGCSMPSGPDLTPWAVEGVLLLNVTLTVRAGTAGSHADWGWQGVTTEVLRVCARLPRPVAFLLWGNHARDAAHKAGIPFDSRVFCSSHPSPLGAYRATKTLPAFFGSRPFSRVNDFLRASGAGEIQWELP